jgi:hypothetical protein
MALELNGTTGVNLVQDGTVTAADLASTLDLTGKTVTLPAGVGGKVLQVVSYTKTDHGSTTSTSPTDTGMSVTLTPASASSKVLLFAHVNWSRDADKRVYFRFVRNSTAIALGDAGTGQEATFATVSRAGDGFIIHTLSGAYLDSPSTSSSVTYKLQWWVEANTGYLNRPATIDANGANTISTLTAMEIAA